MGECMGDIYQWMMQFTLSWSSRGRIYDAWVAVDRPVIMPPIDHALWPLSQITRAFCALPLRKKKLIKSNVCSDLANKITRQQQSG